jgi:aminopeptidase N
METKTFYLSDYKLTDYTIAHVDLNFRLDFDTTIVTAKIDFKRKNTTDIGTPLVLDGDGLNLVSLKINGKTMSCEHYSVTPDELVFFTPPHDDAFQLEIITHVAPLQNKSLMGLYVSDNIFCTQCEATGFRRITYFLDRPDVLATYSVRLEAHTQTAPILLSNGNRGTSGSLENGWHFAQWHDPYPKPCYLFALVAGDLGVLKDEFITTSGRNVALAIYVEHGKELQASYAMDSLIRSMKWDEDKFGREYDLDVFNIVAVSSFNMGAMENKGLNIFNDKYVLADPSTATDSDYANIEAIIAHEYFHNWTGNRITCRDWFQLCLKEGLTVYRDHEFSADMRSRTVRRILEVKTLKASQFPEDQGSLAHPVRPRSYKEINNFYTATVYEKGSELIRMLRILIGDIFFRSGMDLYFNRHDGQAVTIEDFIACFQEVSSQDLTQFALWYHQAGTPNLFITSTWNKEEKTFTLDIEQSSLPTPGEPKKLPLHIPIQFGLLDKRGDEMRASTIDGAQVEGDVIHIKDTKQRVVFHGISERPIPSLLRGFSAPVNLISEQSAQDLLFLAQYDKDLYARWQALNALNIKILISATHTPTAEFSSDYLSIFGKLCCDDTLEPAFRALNLTLPQESEIAREIGKNVDPNVIHVARNSLMKAILHHTRDVFHTILHELKPLAIFSPDATSAGKRALLNVVLNYLACNGSNSVLCSKYYNNATNMTDRSAALTMLAHYYGQSSETLQALEHFETHYGDDLLVIDKWFSIQATAPGEATLAKVEQLTNHKAFSFENPNRMRALVGSFAASNLTGFHRGDGKGYAFLANFIVRVDQLNPQTASRILTSMRNWRMFEPARFQQSEFWLKYIASVPTLSTDVRDIVERILA